MINKTKEPSRLGVFVFYDSEGIVDDYVLYLLRDMKEVLSQLIIVINGYISPSDRIKLEKISKKILVRDNVGFDAVAWKYAMVEYLGWEKTSFYDEIVLFNDSFFGPFYPMKQVFHDMDDKDVDFWGLTCHYALSASGVKKKYGGLINYLTNQGMPTHIQSYFMVIRRKMHTSELFRSYWDDLPTFSSFTETVGRHEVVFTQLFARNGFKWTVFAEMTHRKSRDLEKNYDFTAYNPYELISKNRLPILKRKNFMRPLSYTLQYNQSDEMHSCMKYIHENTSYDESMIWKHVLRKFNIVDIFESVGLRYILPTDFKKANWNSCLSQTLVVMHIYYLDQLDYIDFYINNIPKEIQVIITTSTEKRFAIVQETMRKYNNVSIRLVESRGRDLSALLVGVREEIIKKYKYLCFVHDKKSSHENPSVGFAFQELLWRNMLGSKSYVYNVLDLFEKYSQLGLLVPPCPSHGDYNCNLGSRWGDNFGHVDELIKKFNLHVNHVHDRSPLSIGSVFWCRVDALKKLFDYPWSYEDFPKEPMALDGTVSHALERIFPYVAQDAGYFSGWVMTEREAAVEARNMRYMLERMVYTLRYNKSIFPGFNLWTPQGIAIKDILKKDGNNEEDDYFFPYHLVDRNDRVVIYGAAEEGRQFYNHASKYGDVKIIAIIDDSKDMSYSSTIPTMKLSDLNTLEYDKIIISNSNPKFAGSIKDKLMDIGVDENSILWSGDVYHKEKFWRWYLEYMRKQQDFFE